MFYIIYIFFLIFYIYYIFYIYILFILFKIIIQMYMHISDRNYTVLFLAVLIYNPIFYIVNVWILILCLARPRWFPLVSAVFDRAETLLWRGMFQGGCREGQSSKGCIRKFPWKRSKRQSTFSPWNMKSTSCAWGRVGQWMAHHAGAGWFFRLQTCLCR